MYYFQLFFYQILNYGLNDTDKFRSEQKQNFIF